jgi:hypothetical protein
MIRHWTYRSSKKYQHPLDIFLQAWLRKLQSLQTEASILYGVMLPSVCKYMKTFQHEQN